VRVNARQPFKGESARSSGMMRIAYERFQVSCGKWTIRGQCGFANSIDGCSQPVGGNGIAIVYRGKNARQGCRSKIYELPPRRGSFQVSGTLTTHVLNS
jgi:hypothetical protein